MMSLQWIWDVFDCIYKRLVVEQVYEVYGLDKSVFRNKSMLFMSSNARSTVMTPIKTSSELKKFIMDQAKKVLKSNANANFIPICICFGMAQRGDQVTSMEYFDGDATVDVDDEHFVPFSQSEMDLPLEKESGNIISQQSKVKMSNMNIFLDNCYHFEHSFIHHGFMKEIDKKLAAYLRQGQYDLIKSYVSSTPMTVPTNVNEARPFIGIFKSKLLDDVHGFIPKKISFHQSTIIFQHSTNG